MTAVAGTRFTNPKLIWLSQTFVHSSIFITAVSRGGVVKQDVISNVCVYLISAPLYLLMAGLEGIRTGWLILACVILLIENRKAGTKPLIICLRGIGPSKHFQCFALTLSYVNVSL